MRYLYVLSILVLFACGHKTADQKPNIVLIYADDLGWADVGYNGTEIYETPYIDQLAREGMVFNRFYPAAANCAPSRACMLTGMYTPRHAVYLPQGLSRGGAPAHMRYKVPTRDTDSTFNTFQVSINHVAPEFESLAELLKKVGYVSARIGKWHIGDDNQGFDMNSAYGMEGVITNINGTEQRYYADTLVAERMTTTAIKFISDQQHQPFFVYLSHWEVHGPMAARQDRIDYYRQKIQASGTSNVDPVYAAEVEQIDRSVGRVMVALENLQLEDQTIFIFTSDNGGVSANTSNKPLRAGKGTFYEGGIRTPMCIRWPGVVKPGTFSDIPVIGVDFMPTFAEIAGASLPSHQAVDGRSIVPILRGQESEAARAIFFHFPLYLGGGGPDQVLPTYDSVLNYWRAVPLSVIIRGDWKLIYYYEYDRAELYDLEEDISESEDLSESNKEVKEQLLKELQYWVKETRAPVPSVLNNTID